MSKTEAIKEVIKLMAENDLSFQDIVNRYKDFQFIEPKFERKEIG